MIALMDTVDNTTRATEPAIVYDDGVFIQLCNATRGRIYTFNITRSSDKGSDTPSLKKVDKRPFHIRMKDHPKSRRHN